MAKTEDSARATGIDAFRWFSFLAVVFIHAIRVSDNTAINWEGVVNQLARFAVPFFFICSGYFFGLRAGEPKYINQIVKVATRLLPAFIF